MNLKQKYASQHQRQSQIHTNSTYFLLIPSINNILQQKQLIGLHSIHSTLPYFFLIPIIYQRVCRLSTVCPVETSQWGTSVSSGIRQGWNRFFLGPDTSCYGQWHILEGTYPVPSCIFLKVHPGTLFWTAEHSARLPCPWALTVPARKKAMVCQILRISVPLHCMQ